MQTKHAHRERFQPVSVETALSYFERLVAELDELL
jgi:hypothetical protein